MERMEVVSWLDKAVMRLESYCFLFQNSGFSRFLRQSSTSHIFGGLVYKSVCI